MKGLFQCPPWARSFWAFSPYLNHMLKFSIYYVKGYVNKKRNLLKEDSFLSLLSDSNQRPRDYKSRALAN